MTSSKIKNLPSSIKHLKKLQDLDLSKSEITEIPVEIGEC